MALAVQSETEVVLLGQAEPVSVFAKRHYCPLVAVDSERVSMYCRRPQSGKEYRVRQSSHALYLRNGLRLGRARLVQVERVPNCLPPSVVCNNMPSSRTESPLTILSLPASHPSLLTKQTDASVFGWRDFEIEDWYHFADAAAAKKVCTLFAIVRTIRPPPGALLNS
jgi:hypothetical protein